MLIKYSEESVREAIRKVGLAPSTESKILDHLKEKDEQKIKVSKNITMILNQTS
jgi:hypothetical protein